MDKKLVSISISYIKDEPRGYPKHVFIIDGTEPMEGIFDDKVKIEIQPYIKHEDGTVENI